MVSKTDTLGQKYTASEIGTIRKPWRGRTRIALVYPNRYHIGMSNLGFQTIYQLLNSFDHVVCERAFLPDNARGAHHQLRTIESGKPLADTDIIAFSLSFENDYPHILSILENSGIAYRSDQR
jgi:hypothetical protein